jgi:hypothetical protein
MFVRTFLGGGAFFYFGYFPLPSLPKIHHTKALVDTRSTWIQHAKKRAQCYAFHQNVNELCNLQPISGPSLFSFSVKKNLSWATLFHLLGVGGGAFDRVERRC